MQLMSLLILEGAFINAEDDMCFTPLLLAEVSGKEEIADLLLMHGADTRCVSRRGDCIAWPCLLKGDLQRLDRLVKEFKIDLSVPLGPNKWSVLHRAILHIEDQIFAEKAVGTHLHFSSSSSSITAPAASVSVPASASSDLTCGAVMLLSLGAKPDARTLDGKTPLFFAVHRSNLPMVRALLLAGANVNATDNADNTPLHFARSVEIAQELLQRGAKPSAKNKFGQVPRAFHSSCV